MKAINIGILILLVLVATIAQAQTVYKTSYYAIRVGFLNASTELSSSSTAQRLGGIAPLNSYYVGALYQRDNVLPGLSYRAEVTYQRKGIEYQNFDGYVVTRQKFHYVGLTPLIGIMPVNGLGLFVGPEINISIGQSAWTTTAVPIEYGIASRLSYRYRWIGAEVGYFSGLNEFTSLELGARFGFKNRTWQAGLFIVPSKIRRK